jgi:hypothetical protein
MSTTTLVDSPIYFSHPALVVLEMTTARTHANPVPAEVDRLVELLEKSPARVTHVFPGPGERTHQLIDRLWEALLTDPPVLLLLIDGPEIPTDDKVMADAVLIPVLEEIAKSGQPTLLVYHDHMGRNQMEKDRLEHYRTLGIEKRVGWSHGTTQDIRLLAFQILRRILPERVFTRRTNGTDDGP